MKDLKFVTGSSVPKAFLTLKPHEGFKGNNNLQLYCLLKSLYEMPGASYIFEGFHAEFDPDIELSEFEEIDCEKDVYCYQNTFYYRGYTGSSEYSEKDKVFFGEILAITDSVSYEAKTRDDLREEFKIAVDDYIDMLKETGKHEKD